MNTFMGFGDVATQSAAVAKPSTWDKISNILTNVVKPAADIYTQVNPPSSGSSSPIPTSPQPAPWNANPTASTSTPANDNTKKYLLIGGAVVAAGAVVYFATRKKGKK